MAYNNEIKFINKLNYSTMKISLNVLYNFVS